MDELETGAGIQRDEPLRPKRKMRRLTKWFLWIGAVVLVVLVAVGITIGILLHRAEPIIRASLIDTLQKRFRSKVELDNLHVSIIDGFRVEANGLRIWLPDETQEQIDAQTAEQAAARSERRNEPWIIVTKMHFHASWRILPGKPIVISVVHVEGVRVILPPKDDRPHFSQAAATPGNARDASVRDRAPVPIGSQAATVAPEPPDQINAGKKDAGKSTNTSLFKMPQIEVRKIECQDALLVIERKQEPGKVKIPLDFQFKNVVVIPDGKGGPMAYSVDMVNAKPIGTIHTTGHAGPWITGEPGALPVKGTYSFNNADLSTIKGIAGILSSTGDYSGTLRRIDAQGQTLTPDFRLDRVARGSGLPLTTHFHAVVDGTNGNTYLQPVDGMLGHTHILAKGQVVRAEDVPGWDGKLHGHDIVLQVTIDRGRIDDVLQISAGKDKPFMTGNLTLNTNFHLPPGKESVWDKLLLDGQFHLSEARFNSDTMQGRIEQLSLRGQGKPGEVKSTDPTSILSEMQGHFKLGGGMLQLPDLHYQVPGAEIVAHGVYGLRAGSLNFEGDARLDATLSKVVGGWKGFLLKPADRILKKNGAGMDVPIHVEGTRKQPKFGVDFGRMGKNTKPDESDEKDDPK